MFPRKHSQRTNAEGILIVMQRTTALTLLLFLPGCVEQSADPETTAFVTGDEGDTSSTSSTSSDVEESTSSEGTTSETTGDTTTGSTSSKAKPPECGNNKVEQGEDCDLGWYNGLDGIDCTADCYFDVCGNEHIGAGEDCDLGPENGLPNSECTEDCLFHRCGDGILGPDELCDDGNFDEDDHCGGVCDIPRRFVFVTSETTSGLFPFKEGADAFCRALAAESIHPQIQKAHKRFRAWISDGKDSPATLFDKSFSEYVYLEGNKMRFLASSWEDLTNGDEMWASLQYDEDGFLVEGIAWTNVSVTGVSAGKGNCNGWGTKSEGFLGGVGHIGKTGPTWTDGGELTCDGEAHLYCFEDL